MAGTARLASTALGLALGRCGAERGLGLVKADEQHTGPMAAPRLRSLFECLGEVPECRRDRGKRYPLNTVLAIAVAARLAGYRGVNAFAQFAALLSQEQLEAVGAFWSPSKQRYTAPAITTFHNILAALPPETLDNAIGQWTGQHSTAHAPVAMDGKDLRGASKQTEDGRRMMVAAVEHDSGMVLGQVEVDSKSNEIPAVRELSSSLDLAGRIVTVDAMHAQHETARCLLGRRADYVISAIKDNQETILEDLKAIDFSDAPWHETVDKGHGRIERRRCAAVDLSGAEWDGYANLHGRRQTMRIEREREILKTGKSSIEVTWSLTSLGTDRAGPEELLALVRNHWHIENRLHYVRDFTYDEDRCRAYVRHLPRNLACLTNVAIAIVRCSGRFRYLPEANRHYAARAQDVVHRRVRHAVAPHQLVPAVHVDMVLVAVMALAVLLGPARVGILLGPLGRLVLPALGRLAILDPRVVVPAIALFGHRHDRGVDDLAAHRQVALLLQIAVEVLEQCLDHARLRQLFPVEPHRLGVGDLVLETETQEPHEREAVAKLVLHLVVREIVKLAENDRLEHHHSVPGLTPRRRLPFLGRLAPYRIETWPEVCPPNHFVDLHQRVVLGVQTSIPLRDVEKPHLAHSRFPRIPLSRRQDSTQLRAREGIFRGAL